MISGITNIQKDFSPNLNFWELNPQLAYIDPFTQLYVRDKSKNKVISSKEAWCILWLSDPDEDVNKFYRLHTVSKETVIDACRNFYPDFDPEDEIIAKCLEQYPFLCLSADERAYKDQKDQLIKISKYLNTYEVDLSTLKEVIELKAKMPKIYQDFEKIDKQFQKTKLDQRIHGNRRATARESGNLTPDEDEDDN